MPGKRCEMRSVISGIMAAALLTAGCNGGGSKITDPAQQPGTPEFKAVVDAIKLERLAPAALAGGAAISGQLTLSGIQVLDSAGQPAPGSGYGNILVRLVDPEDDILSIGETVPDSAGRFTLELAGQPRRGLLEISMSVAADLDGDGTGGDSLRQRVPLALATGKTATADIALRLQAGYQPGSALPVGETPPVVITAQVSTLDADGQRSFNRASNYSGNEVVASVDSHSGFDPQGELRFTDEDGDGLDDASQVFYASTAPFDTVYGVVGQIDRFKREAEVIVKSGDSGYIVRVKIDPQAAVELYLPRTPAGDSFAQLTPDQFLLGRNVYCDGFFTDGAAQREMTALSITVLQ